MATLLEKGESVCLASAVKRLVVSMTWKKGTDFDLAAWFVARDGRSGLVYQCNREARDEQGFVQSLSSFPFMRLSPDSGKGDKQDAAGNKEELVIASVSAFSQVYLIAWDYSAVAGKSADKEGPAIAKGSPARFEGTDLAITLADDGGNEYHVTFELEAGMLARNANVGLVAILDNSGVETRLTHSSHAENFYGLYDTQQLIDFVRHAEEALEQW